MLRYAAADLQADKEVVLTAVAQDGSALEFASDGLRGNKEVVLTAVAQDFYALEYAAEELRQDRDFEAKIKYFERNEGTTGRKLLALYKQGISMNKVEQRLAFAKALSERLGAGSSFTSEVRNPDIFELIVSNLSSKHSLKFLSFNECVDLFRKYKPWGITSDI